MQIPGFWAGSAKGVGAVMSTRVGLSVLPHGGGAVAIVAASIVVAIIAATVAVERRSNVAVWMIGAFIATFVLVSVVLYLATG
jgi:hypothetical protein